MSILIYVSIFVLCKNKGGKTFYLMLSEPGLPDSVSSGFAFFGSQAADLHKWPNARTLTGFVPGKSILIQKVHIFFPLQGNT